MRRHFLLSSVALFAWTGCAYAQTSSWVKAHHTSRVKQSASSLSEKTKEKRDASLGRSSTHRHRTSLSSHQSETLSVHVARHVSRGPELSVPKSVMQQYVPGTSPYRALDRMPGVSFASTDPMGIDSFGASLYMRGFFMNQLGVTVDGVPLNDQTYQSVDGFSVASAIIPDDIDGITVSQGGGGVDVPSTNTLGGTIRFQSADPENKMGAKVSQGFGSYNSYRTYVRFDSGKLNQSGTKFYTSYARTDAGMWEGGGSQFLQQVDAKLVQPLGERSKISAFFNWSDLQQWNYPDLSVGIIKNLGWRVPHLYPDYEKAYHIAQQCQTNPNPVVPGYSGVPGISSCQTALYDGGQREINYMGGLNLDFALTDRLTWHTTIYGHSQTGYYSYTDYDDPTSSEVPLSEEVWQNRQERYGIDTSLRYHIGRHHIEGGIWYENDNQQAGVYNYREPALGQGAPLKAIGPYTVYGQPFMQGYNFEWRTNVLQAHIQDTVTLARGLTLNAGFRTMTAQTSGGANANDAAWTGASELPNGRLRATRAFLPHFDLDWRINRQHEFYIDVAENMRAYEVSAYGVANSLYSVQDQATFLRQKHETKPSRAWTYMGGYRYTSPWVQLNATVYHSTILHQLSSATVGTLTNPISQVIDFGRISLTGANGLITITPLPGLSITNSVSYNKGTYSRNVNTEGGYYALRGKKIVNYPSWMYKTAIAYTWRGATVHFDANYYGKRYFSYMNDTSVGSYWVANTGITYRFKRLAGMHDVTCSFNVYNLFNNKYISTMGENDNPASGDYQSMERGAVREFFGTISTSF
nr:TonB-dependent receptor plug domain-containing protein [Saccharibacter sp. 17.LH.SD]